MQELLPAGKRPSADPGRQETSVLSQLVADLQTQDASIKQLISPRLVSGQAVLGWDMLSPTSSALALPAPL